VILPPFGIRKRRALYDQIGNKKKAERVSYWLIEGTPRPKMEE
jgi:hypothetical protein